MKATAAVLGAFNEPLSFQEFDVQPLAEGEVLVKILAAGVCGSDVHMHRGKDPRTPLPMILGHEGVWPATGREIAAWYLDNYYDRDLGAQKAFAEKWL